MIKRGRHAIRYGDTTISYRVQPITNLSDRVRIHIDPDAHVLVEVPRNCDIGAVRQAVRARARWICDRLEEVAVRKANILPREYVSGESHLYLGRRYMLKVLAADNDNPPGVKLTGASLKVWVDERKGQPRNESVRNLLRVWYRRHAYDRISRRLEAVQLSVPWLKRLPEWRLLTMKRQWGSCSPSRVVLVNPSLIKAPARCIDYVLVHELCHLKEHNHSPRFYRLLERSFPGWEDAKRRLDDIAESILCD